MTNGVSSMNKHAICWKIGTPKLRKWWKNCKKKWIWLELLEFKINFKIKLQLLLKLYVWEVLRSGCLQEIKSKLQSASLLVQVWKAWTSRSIKFEVKMSYFSERNLLSTILLSKYCLSMDLPWLTFSTLTTHLSSLRWQERLQLSSAVAAYPLRKLWSLKNSNKSQAA